MSIKYYVLSIKIFVHLKNLYCNQPLQYRKFDFLLQENYKKSDNHSKERSTLNKSSRQNHV